MNKPLWRQFGASIDMLENAIRHCPAAHWNTERKFWYNAYHCLFWLDYYLTTKPTDFQPPAPFTLSEFDPAGLLPDQVYSKAMLLTYLEHSREKAHALINNLTETQATARWIDDYKDDFSVFEILIYNMRHVQHHVGQLNLILRQEIDDAPRWVSKSSS